MMTQSAEAVALEPSIVDERLNTTLYTTHSSGQVGSWQIQVFDEKPFPRTRVTALKKLDGTPVVTDGFTEKGKNIGRSNETTPIMQALLEAESKINKKLDKGYTHEMPDGKGKATNALGFLRPMLAQPIDKVKGWAFPVAAQPKMDGHRMLATVQDHKVVLYSRQGKVLDVEHIRSALQEAYDQNYWAGQTLDGEVYAHGQTLQRISSWVKKPKPESINLVYNLYDIMLDVCYEARLRSLRRIVTQITSEKVRLTQTDTLYDDSELDELHAKYIGLGFEGTIVRHGQHPYEDGKRSKSLLKKKDFQDAEFEIIGIQRGKRNERHDLEVGIYECKTKDGKTFTVTAPGDMYEKNQHALAGSSNIGKQLTVKFFNYTPDGLPFHPVALRVREDI